MSSTHTVAMLDTPHRLTFETAAAHATTQVPIAEPTALARDTREALINRSYESASHLVVCRAGRFVGIVTIEDLLRSPGESTVESLMDRDAPVVAPGVDQEQAAWHAVRHGESALAVVDQLHVRWRGREVAPARVFGSTLALIGAGILGTFPPLWALLS
jgi:CBS domain-containing protein